MSSGWRLRCLSLIPLLALLWLCLQPLRAHWQVEALLQGRLSPDSVSDNYFSAEPGRVSARLMMARGGFPAELIRRDFQQALDRRPLHAGTWLDWAELEWRLGGDRRSGELAEKAARLWPGRADHLWRLAQLQLRLGQAESALATLTKVVAADPGNAQRALNLLIKLDLGLESLMSSFGPLFRSDPDHLGFRMFRYALRLEDAALSEALWREAPQALRVGQDWLRPYLDDRLRRGHLPQVCSGWQLFRPGEDCWNTLRNGSFAEPLAQFGLGWQWRDGAGYQIETLDDGQGLKIAFDGSENVHLRSPWQPVLLRGSDKLRLSGRWRGEGVTTRSGVYLELLLECGGSRRVERLSDRYGDWDWQEFELTVQAGNDCDSGRVALARDRSRDLDNLISGQVTVSDLKLERVKGDGGARH